jgi:arabinofuranosyltransferase
MDNISNNMKSGINTIAILIIFILFYTVIVIRCAWLGDDAYITFRVVDNFINGYGLRWNIAERVQTYTHPLWMLLISFGYFITGNIYYTGIFTSIVISIATVCIFAFAFPISIYSAILGISVLTASKAYIDYSTSGLENPLTHLILVLFFYIYIRWENSSKKIFYLALIASLAAVNRMDTILLVLPALVYSFLLLKQFKNSLKSLLLGFLPFIAWELFSLVYYGFLFPNTAYAKLNTGIAALPLIKSGLYYTWNSLMFDPLTLTVIFIAIVVSLFKKVWRFLSISIGIILYILYVIKIGGCFMSGRYFSAPLLCSVIIIVSLCFKTYNKTWLSFFLLIIVIVSLFNPRSPILSNSNYSLFNTQKRSTNKLGHNYPGINRLLPKAKCISTSSDERAFYYPETGLLRVMSNETPDPSWTPAIKLNLNKIIPMDRMDSQSLKTTAQLQPVSANSTMLDIKWVIGRLGFAAGPSVHIVDVLALADPLLARLNTAEKVDFAIGHFKRRIPLGYLKTLRTGKNYIENKNLSLFYEKLTIITRGRIFDIRRFFEIMKMNLGFYNYLTLDYDILPKVHAKFPKVVTREEPLEEQGLLFTVK